MNKLFMKFIVCIVLFFSVNVYSITDTDSLKLIKTKNGINNIYFRGSNLTKFSNPHEIYAYQISPNGLWALVWHQDHRPRKLTIYDLQKQTLYKEIIPGFGGEISWTAYNNIYHIWGCGTNCVMMSVYDIEGKTLLNENYCGLDIDPSKNYFVTSPSDFACEPFLRIFSFNNFKNIYTSKQEDDIRVVDNISWEESGSIRIIYYDSKEEKQSKIINYPK